LFSHRILRGKKLEDEEEEACGSIIETPYHLSVGEAVEEGVKRRKGRTCRLTRREG